MLELYHHGSSVCAAKVRLVLEEKELDFEKHYIDLLRGDQFHPDYLKLNPKGVVPTLVHDSKVITESTVICEYLEWVFPDTSRLIPADPVSHAEMLYWTKFVDEELHWACGTLTFMSSHRFTIGKMGPEKVNEFLDSTPVLSLASDWKVRKRRYIEDGFDDPDAHKAILVHELTLKKMDKALQNGPYLTGEDFTLADTALIPYLNRLHKLQMLDLWCKPYPNALQWFERMRQRSSFSSAVDKYLPPSLANDLETNGRKSWPRVEAILAQVRQQN